jgi:hypothetical protein
VWGALAENGGSAAAAVFADISDFRIQISD